MKALSSLSTRPSTRVSLSLRPRIIATKTGSRIAQRRSALLRSVRDVRSSRALRSVPEEQEEQILSAEVETPEAISAADSSLSVKEVEDVDESVLVEEERPEETQAERLAKSKLYDCHIRIKQLFVERDYAACWEVYEELLKDGLKPDRFTYAILLRLCNRQARTAKATELWNELKEREDVLIDIILYNSYMQSKLKANNIPMALEVFDEMKAAGIEPDIVTYNTLLSGFAGSGNYRHDNLRKVDLLLAEVKDSGFELDAFSYRALIKLSLNARDVQKALRYANAMMQKDLIDTSYMVASIFQMFADTCSMSDIREKVVNVCWKMYLETEKKWNKPSDEVYVSLLDMFARFGHWSRVFGLLDLMEQKGIDRDARCYNVLYNGISRSRDLDLDAVALSKVLLEDSDSRGINTRDASYERIIEICLRSRDIETAKMLVERMKENQVPVQSRVYLDFLEHYTDADYVSNWPLALADVLSVVDEMRESSVRLNLNCYDCIIKAACKCQNWEVLDQTLAEMKDCRLHPLPRSYNILIDACAKSSDPARMEQAWELFSEMKRFNSNRTVVTYTSMITVCDAMRDLEAGMQLLSEMKEVGIHPNERTYTSLMHLAGENGDIEMVENLFDTILSSGLRLNTTVYSVLIHSYGKANRIDKVLEVYKELQAKGGFIDLAVFCNLISAAGECNRVDLVYKFFDEFRKTRIPLSHSAYTLLHSTLEKVGDEEGAAAVLELEKEERKRTGPRYAAV